MNEKPTKTKNKLIVYLTAFIIAWFLVIFSVKKNDFDIEFREKGVTTATIFDFGTEEVLEELYNERQTNVYEIEYVEYFYFVNGKKYKDGSMKLWREFCVGDEIQIEYVISNPEVTRIKGMKRYSFNFFVRNLPTVLMLSFILVLGTSSLVEFIIKCR